jgi:multidrug efflux pump subunit AcrA (membrane-fusion protein)
MFAALAAIAWWCGTALAGDDSKSLPIKLVTHKVKFEKLQPLIVERGSLESANSSDIVCRVRAPAQGAMVATTIKRVLVEDGAQVKKGDVLVELDDSALQEQLQVRRIALDKAEADKVQAEENYKIALSQNTSDIKTAELTLELTQLDLEKYLKGGREQLLRDLKSRLLLAEADVEQWTEALEHAERKLKQKEVPENEVRAVRLRLQAARLALEKSQQDLQLFEKYSRPRTETDLRGKAAEAERALEHAKQQAKGKESVARLEAEAKKTVYQQELTRFKEIADEIKKCKLVAPQDGMVVYYVPEQVRFGASQQYIVAQGEPVREGQKLMSIPDLSKMQVVIRVPEALVTQVRPGLPAVLRVDAFPDRALRGTVRQVATTPSATDWLTADEKVYRTVIAIDGDTASFRPGMSAAVTIPLGKERNDVLAVPARALIGRGGIGRTVSCLVLTADGPEEREVVLGLRNELTAEIASGLREGDEVIVNPQLLLHEIRDRIRFLRSGRPAARRGE